ncbi:MAG: hypothetical protein ACK43N_13870, partial [Pirellulaceae bacterium]
VHEPSDWRHRRDLERTRTDGKWWTMPLSLSLSPIAVRVGRREDKRVVGGAGRSEALRTSRRFWGACFPLFCLRRYYNGLSREVIPDKLTAVLTL